MTASSALPRKLLVLGIVLPIAVLVGYLLGDPDWGSFSIVGLLVATLFIPLFLRWHHSILVFSWNLSMLVFFLPGSPPFWMLAGLISLGLTALARIMNKDMRVLHVPSVTWSLLFLALVVVFTMAMTGVMGVRSLGGASYGGKKYFFILFAIVAYTALSSLRIPIEKANAYVAAFLLPGLSIILSNLVYMLGPGMWFFFNLFPMDMAMGQAAEDFSWNPSEVKLGRVAGLGFTSTALLSFMLARYGIRGILDFNRPWRLLVLCGVFAASLMGGFRSILILNTLLCAVQFFLEGMHKTRLFPILVGCCIVGLAMLLPFVQKLPLSAQRTLSILPIEVAPAARYSADASTEWRLRMWEVLWPEVSKHFWVGKGYTANATDYYLAVESQRRGLAQEYELALIAGDYHSGPLSLMIPFGFPGVLAFVLFLVAASRVLYLNFRHGPAPLKTINTFLFASFMVRTFFFLALFGAVHSDILVLAGLVGFSISVNGGVCQPTGKTATRPAVAGTP
jgi:hypothetical protein